MKIPYVDLAKQVCSIEEELIQACREVFRSGQYILGPAVEEFEATFARLCGTKYAVGVNSGTDALILALRALNCGAGDEIITVPNSFVATTSAICLVGATPRFVDVGPDYLIDPRLVRQAITSKTRGILPVHLTGRPAEMDTLRRIADEHGLFIIEDAAQAAGARYKGRPVGSLGDIGCFSLHPLKTLGAVGDGGVVTSDDSGLIERIRLLRNLGLRTRADCVEWSSNSRLDSLHAALVLVKLRHFDKWTEARRIRAARYRSELSDIQFITVPDVPEHLYSVYHTFVIRARWRDELQEHLHACGIGTSIHYPVPIHQQTAADGLNTQAYPEAEQQAREILSLPVYPELTEAEQRSVITEIHRFYQEKSSSCAYPSTTSTGSLQI